MVSTLLCFGSICLKPDFQHVCWVSEDVIYHFLWLFQLAVINSHWFPFASAVPFHVQQLGREDVFTLTVKTSSGDLVRQQTEEGGGGVGGCEVAGVSHQNPVLRFAAPRVLLDGSHKLNGLLVQHLPDALCREGRGERRGENGRANYIM